YLVEAIQSMCEGEIQQAEQRYHVIDANQYFQRIAQKTGRLLASCCCSGAACAGASQGFIESLGLYGMNIGYAYQIVDDILDFTGDPQATGKPVAADLLNGYITLPIIYLLDNPLDGPWVEEALQN